MVQLGLLVLSANKEDHLQLKPETFYEPAAVNVCNPISFSALKMWRAKKNYRLSCICYMLLYDRCQHFFRKVLIVLSRALGPLNPRESILHLVSAPCIYETGPLTPLCKIPNSDVHCTGRPSDPSSAQDATYSLAEGREFLCS